MSEELNFQCPECLHHNHKLNINIEKGIFNCFHCNFSGKLSKLKKYPHILDQIQDKTALAAHLKVSSFHAPIAKIADLDIDISKLSLLSPEDPEYLYLQGRGWTEEMLNCYSPLRSEESKFNERVIIPIYDKTGMMVYYVARHLHINDGKKYRNAERPKDNILFFSQLSCNLLYKSMAFICEGIFDAAKIPNSVALLGKTLSHGQESLLFDFLRGKKELYVCLDKETSFESSKLVTKIRSWYPSMSLYLLDHSKFTEKDIGDLSISKNSHELLTLIKTNSIKQVPESLSSNLKNRLMALQLS